MKWQADVVDKSVFESKRKNRLLKYFPDLKNEDQYLTEFNVSGHSVFEFNKPIQLDVMDYRLPDYGFNNNLNFYDPEYDGHV